MAAAAFMKMIEAYRDTLGAAYPRQDIAAVVGVFRACPRDEATTQDRIRRTTGLAAGNLSKVVKRAVEKGWIRIAASRGADGTKKVSLTAKGRAMLDDFESRCAAACSDAATIATPSKAKKSRQTLAEQSKTQMGYLAPELAPNTEMADEPGKNR
jgi:DNA-binding MarR family transcriptional regulator